MVFSVKPVWLNRFWLVFGKLVFKVFIFGGKTVAVSPPSVCRVSDYHSPDQKFMSKKINNIRLWAIGFCTDCRLIADCRPGVDFINCFTPYAKLSRLAPNFCAGKKLLKSWAQGTKVRRRGAIPFMKSTPGFN